MTNNFTFNKIDNLTWELGYGGHGIRWIGEPFCESANELIKRLKHEYNLVGNIKENNNRPCWDLPFPYSFIEVKFECEADEAIFYMNVMSRCE